jgi:3-hydroxyacyl-CoA dehydrogenase
VDQGSLGQKTKRGVYMKIGKEIHVLDMHTREYRLSDAKVDDGVKEILRERDWAKKLAGLRNSPHPQAQFLWAVFRDVFHYCALHLEIIANNARDLDFAVRWGFGWDNGPFEIWQAAGWQQVAGWISADIAAGKAMSDVPPACLGERPAAAACMRRRVPTRPLLRFAPPSPRAGEGRGEGGLGSYQPRSTLPVYRRQLYPDHLLGEERHYGETVFETDEVRLWHTGDNIGILSFKTKMHTVSNEVLDGVLRAVDEAEKSFSALILWQPEAPFCAGANLLQRCRRAEEAEGGCSATQGRGHASNIPSRAAAGWARS